MSASLRPMLVVDGVLSPFALSLFDVSAPYFKSIFLILGFALSKTFAHFAQNSTIRGGGGVGSCVGAEMMDMRLCVQD